MCYSCNLLLASIVDSEQVKPRRFFLMDFQDSYIVWTFRIAAMLILVIALIIYVVKRKNQKNGE